MAYSSNRASIQRKPVPDQPSQFPAKPAKPTMPEPVHYSATNNMSMLETLQARSHMQNSTNRINTDDPAFTAPTPESQPPTATHNVTNILTSISATAGDHQRVTFRSDSPYSIPSAPPQALLRRSVPPDMFTRDMSHFNYLYETMKSKDNTETILGMLTCWISLCVLGSAIDVYNKQMRDYVAGMNGRYNVYGVTWAFEFIPFGGAFVSYET
ncbi:hypothetical protein LTR84_005645 [Exophiala bonariae]|uniref:Uncharacterized protein n=1 Tax=Exophiala bonariae TaxID=1690606 RepID=A0AAV9N399_9EURO|nr:hypothetical protein LTR84_005645 [Exophiala bonariae]